MDIDQCGQIVLYFQRAVRDNKLKELVAFVRSLLDARAWEHFITIRMGKPEKNATLGEFLTADPYRGCGYDLATIDALVKQACDPELYARWRKEITAPAHRPDKSNDNIMTSIKAQQGTSRAYTLTRLREQRPDLFKRVAAKELSANAAAVEAGWRTKPTPLDALRKAWAKAGIEERTVFLDEVTNIRDA